MRNEAIAALLIVAIVASAGAEYFVSSASQRTQTSTSTVYTAVPYTQTITVYPNTFTSTGCAYTTFPAAIACPHFWNQDFTISVNYTGAWIASYQGYLGGENVSNLAEASSFYGHGIGTQSFTITGWTPSGGEITGCAEAQKLDASNSTLVLSFPLVNGAENETSTAFGTAKFCLTYVIV
jgi:hypothetical protein